MAELDGPQDSQDEPSVAHTEERVEEAGTVVLAVSGEIDLSSVPALRETLERVVERRPPKIALDLEGVRFMDSSGLALLITVAGQARDLEIRNPSATVSRVIELTGLSSTLRIAR